jgi:hypothetical protein
MARNAPPIIPRQLAPPVDHSAPLSWPCRGFLGTGPDSTNVTSPPKMLSQNRNSRMAATARGKQQHGRHADQPTACQFALQGRPHHLALASWPLHDQAAPAAMPTVIGVKRAASCEGQLLADRQAVSAALHAAQGSVAVPLYSAKELSSSSSSPVTKGTATFCSSVFCTIHTYRKFGRSPFAGGRKAPR